MPIHIPTDSSSTCVHARNIRSCEINIPYACTRIVALTLVCDGQVQRSELGTLDELRGFEQLGLTDAEFQAVVFDLLRRPVGEVVPKNWTAG